MPVESTSSVPAPRVYARPMLMPLGTLADLTRGPGGTTNVDGLGDYSEGEGSI